MGTSAEEGGLNRDRNLIASDRVEGTPVRRSDGEKVGTIERLMIDKRSGKVAYAVMSFGGFMGLGEGYHTLPWGVLTYNPSLDAYEVNITPEQLKGAPQQAGVQQAWPQRGQGPQGGSAPTTPGDHQGAAVSRGPMAGDEGALQYAKQYEADAQGATPDRTPPEKGGTFEPRTDGTDPSYDKDWEEHVHRYYNATPYWNQ